MRIVFIGASGFGLRAAETLSKLADCQLVGVVTAPRQFSISYRPTGVTNVLFADLNEFASARDIPVHVISRGMNEPELFSRISNWRPDCFVVVGWYHMLPASWRKIAPAYGLHASILPNYSGGAPLVWAMINGESSTGITLFQFDDGVDSGPILGSLATDITHGDTIATLYARIEDLGIQLLKENLPLLACGTARFTDQDESKRRLFPQRSPEDGKIDWAQPACRIHDFIRAQTRPYPGAFSYFHFSKITIWQSALLEHDSHDLQPGEFKVSDGRLVVGCGQNTSLELVFLGENDSDINAASWAQSQSLGSNYVFNA